MNKPYKTTSRIISGLSFGALFNAWLVLLFVFGLSQTANAASGYVSVGTEESVYNSPSSYQIIWASIQNQPYLVNGTTQPQTPDMVFSDVSGQTPCTYSDYGVIDIKTTNPMANRHLALLLAAQATNTPVTILVYGCLVVGDGTNGYPVGASYPIIRQITKP
jgi:hypothetical protein